MTEEQATEVKKVTILTKCCMPLIVCSQLWSELTGPPAQEVTMARTHTSACSVYIPDEINKHV